MTPICYQEIAIAAPAATVWDIIKDPMDLHYMPKVTAVEVLDGGTRRLVTIDTREMEGYPDSLVAPEVCFNIDHDEFRYNYTYDGPDLPISDHVATVQVLSQGDTASRLVWSCVWTLTQPMDAAEERTMADGVEAMWKPGMARVKTIAEA